jgi:colanic acid biosynthesis glycosyl transferase WcaI
MHVLILNQTFYPDVAATAQHMWDLARHLDAAGHHVTAITSQSVYGSSERFSKTCERIRNITIHRVPQTAFGKVHTAGRMADFLSFYLSALWRMQTLPAPDAILALTSPPMISVLGHLQKQFRRRDGRRIALVNHVMDLYPDAAVAMGVLGRRGPVTSIMSGLTRRTLTACDALIALGTDMRDLLVDQYLPKSHASRVHVVQPWADKNEITPTDRDTNPLRAKLGLADDFVLLYSGNFGQAHDVDTIVNTIRATRDRTHLKWCFTGGGRGMKILQELATKESWPHVKFLPYQPREALNDLLNLADVHLISQAPAFTGIVVPSKLFGILAAGKPSIMVGPADAEASRILTECDAGIVVKPGEVDSMLAAIERLQIDADARRAMGERARNALCDVYDGRLSCAKIEKILLQAVEDANADPR